MLNSRDLRDGCPGGRNRSGCIYGCIRPRSVGSESDHARPDDLPIPLGRSRLITGSTTLKASDPRGTGGSNPTASATLNSINAGLDDRLPVSVLAVVAFLVAFGLLCLWLGYRWFG